MINLPREQAMGLTWNSQWTSVGEGPYTLTAKLAAANPMPARVLRPMLMEVQSTSQLNHTVQANTFLSSRWMRRGASLCAWSHSLSQSTLSATIGAWAQRLADDRHLRYCPACLNAGFQSALCQISAWDRCPVHGRALVTACQHCGGPAPAYAWHNQLDESMSCPHCALPLSDAWSPGSALRWRAMPGAATYVDLGAQLSVFRSAEWTDAVGWTARYAAPEHQEAGRRAEFALLAKVMGIPTHTPAWEIEESVPEHFLLDAVEEPAPVITQEMRAVYQTFCERIALSQGEPATDEAIACFLTFRTRAFKVEDFKEPQRFAYILFRRRFEVTDARTDPPGLSDRFLSESTKGLLGSFAADLRAWARFLDMCYQAEVRYCRLLQAKTRGMAPGERRWMETIGQHSAALSPLMLRLPYGLGMLRVSLGGKASVVIALAPGCEY